MAANKQAESKVHPALEHKSSRISKFIACAGNFIIVLEFILIVFLSVKAILDIGGWEGVALVIILLPAEIMIFLLTRSLKCIFVRKYAISSNSSEGELDVV
ncbi:unnamed protein product [Alopecurus aequalis]